MHCIYNDRDDIIALYEEKSTQLNHDYLAALEKFDLTATPNKQYTWQSVFDSMLEVDDIFAAHLTRIANEEMCGHQLITLIASNIEDNNFRQKVQAHAQDELRHAFMYRSMSDRLLHVKKGDIEIKSINPTNELGNDFSEGDFNHNLKIFLISIHMGEIRGYLSLKYLLSKLVERKEKHIKYFYEKLEKIEKDESNHIVYTGLKINQYLNETPKLKHILMKYAQRYQAFWWQDIEFLSGKLKAFHEKEFAF